MSICVGGRRIACEQPAGAEIRLRAGGWLVGTIELETLEARAESYHVKLVCSFADRLDSVHAARLGHKKTGALPERLHVNWAQTPENAAATYKQHTRAVANLIVGFVFCGGGRSGAGNVLLAAPVLGLISGH